MGKYERLLKNYDAHAKRIRQSTEINIFETLQERKDRIAELEKDYAKWFTYYFPKYAKKPCAWFHIWLAKLILSNPICYVLVNWYRGAAKSVHTCMGIPLFLMIHGELDFMLLVGQTEKKAKRLLSDIQIQLKYNQKFINDYGEQFSYGDWADGEFLTKDGVRFVAIGLDQSARGFRQEANRPDYIVVDDVDTQKRCKNPSLVKEAVNIITEDLWGCFDSDETGRERFVLSNNRISKMSIVQLMIDQFKVLREEMEANGYPEVHHVSRVIAHDRKFNPSWPERTSRDYWKKKKATRPKISYHREYLDDPIEEGKLFKADNILKKKMLPLEEYDALAIYGDLSYKDEGDFKALRFWGKKRREKHLINCYVRQSSRRAAAIWLYDLFEDLDNRSNHLNISVQIEGLFAQDEFVNDFDLEGDERDWWIAVVPDKRPKANKYDRIESTTGIYERHWVWYNEELYDTPDFQEGLTQLLAFEKGSSVADDAPDADHGAFDLLDRKVHVDAHPPRTKQRKTAKEKSDW